MLQYLIVILDDTSISYCSYENRTASKLISIEDLRAGILYGMKENLMIQFVYPDYELPTEYKKLIDTIDHVDIVPYSSSDVALVDGAGVLVFDDWKMLLLSPLDKSKVYILRSSKERFFDEYKSLVEPIKRITRLNVVLTDVESFKESDFEKYRSALRYLSDIMRDCYVEGKYSQLNILTDRMMLDGMKNCNAGVESITLAPDGRFYVCPAFYYAGVCDGKEKTHEEECKKGYSVGSLHEGLDVRNPQLYRLDHSPLCSRCDAYQCRRCVWLNRRTTLDVNTPSHEQCVVAHLERNASRELLHSIRKSGEFLPDKDIKEIDYLDPFDVRKENLG